MVCKCRSLMHSNSRYLYNIWSPLPLLSFAHSPLLLYLYVVWSSRWGHQDSFGLCEWKEGSILSSQSRFWSHGMVSHTHTIPYGIISRLPYDVALAFPPFFPPFLSVCPRYSVGTDIRPGDLEIHRAMTEWNESPIFLLLVSRRKEDEDACSSTIDRPWHRRQIDWLIRFSFLLSFPWPESHGKHGRSQRLTHGPLRVRTPSCQWCTYLDFCFSSFPIRDCRGKMMMKKERKKEPFRW